MEFTYGAYQDLLVKIIKAGYEICNYSNYKENSKFVIVRHDVDNDLSLAAKLAAVESSVKVSSTYFVLISSNFYNCFSYESQKAINEIVSCGHDIGLHFDETKYNCDTFEELKHKIYEESKLLETMCDVKVNAVSMHRPSKRVLEENLELENIENTYGKKFFEDIKYVSDSRMHWGADIESIIKKGEFNKMQLLTHAFWYRGKEHSIDEIIKEFVNSANQSRYMYLNENIRNLSELMSNNEVVK